MKKDHDDAEPIDLENVDYDDVLHLYRGWRRAEASLKERDAECDALKEKINQLQDSHTRFRSQIQALESVKDLTMSLQSQLNMVQQENAYLTKDNKQLNATLVQNEQRIQEIISKDNERNKALREAQNEASLMRERYQEVAISHKELENILANEVALKVAAEARLVSDEDTIDALRTENNSLKLKLDATLLRMSQCDQELAHASEQLAKLTEELNEANTARERMITAEAEIGVLRGDISRLLRLLEHYPAAQEFLDSWNDSDALSFTGMPVPKPLMNATLSSTGGGIGGNMTMNGTTSSESNPLGIDYSRMGIDDEREFDEFDGEFKADPDITPSEFAQLKRIYGGDPFPMTSSFDEEADLWVPRKAAHLGLQFLASKIPHAPPRLITDFLRKINKIWLRREARKLEKLKNVYEARIADFKRRLNQQKPYRGVMADTTIRRLKTQVREDLTKALTGRPKRPTEDTKSDRNYFDETDDASFMEELSKSTTARRPCEAMLRRKGGGSIVNVSKEKLLEASLLSLETLGRQKTSGVEGSGTADLMSSTGFGGVMGMEDTMMGITGGISSGVGGGGGGVTSSIGLNPSEQYLRGALWLGRNLTMVMEELAEGLDFFRSKYLSEVAAASTDVDMKRCKHRLNLLAGSGINEAVALTNKSRVRAREILQGAASISPGDLTMFQEFLRTLPIESALAPPGNNTNQFTPNTSMTGRRASSAGTLNSSRGNTPSRTGRAAATPGTNTSTSTTTRARASVNNAWSVGGSDRVTVTGPRSRPGSAMKGRPESGSGGGYGSRSPMRR